MKSRRDPRAALDRALVPTSACIPVERLGEAPTAAESAHMTGCARCQTEWALWQQFDRSTPASDEGAAVQWVVAELQRRRGGGEAHPVRARRWLTWPRFAVAAVPIAVAAAIGVGLWNPEPSPRVPQGRQVYRTAGVQAMAPLGDVPAAPGTLEWAPVGGAVLYEVQILEVDRAVMWRGSTSAARIDVPPQVAAQFVAGKTMLWIVSARNADGAVVGESPAQRFRVAARRAQ